MAELPDFGNAMQHALDNRNWFGTRGLEVQILSLRPFPSLSINYLRGFRLLRFFSNFRCFRYN
jgi:hypothetical protein